MFRALKSTTARWQAAEGIGLEQLHLSRRDDAIVARGIVIGERGGTPYGAQYEVTCDDRWCVREFFVSLTDGRSLHMMSTGQGRWRIADGRHDPRFDGCIDIDLAATPFTNTLPIRRAGLQTNETRNFRMLYVPFDTLLPLVDDQRYICLRQDALYRYEAVDRSFSADLPVDEDGLVVDYPTLFKRLA